jgi:hypothetical protein
MSELWQNVIIVLAVGSALTYLVVLLVGRRRKRRACSECRLMQAVTGNKHNSSADAPLN